MLFKQKHIINNANIGIGSRIRVPNIAEFIAKLIGYSIFILFSILNT
jgi:hypothetical protein